MLRQFVKKWIFLAVILLFDFIIAVRTSYDFFFFFFWLLVSSVAVNLALLAVSRLTLRLKLERSLPVRVDEDDALKVRALIRNNGFLPVFNMVIEDDLSCAPASQRRQSLFADFVGPKGSLELDYGCDCPRRGRYLLGPFSAYLFDPLHLFFFKKTYPLYSEFYVYPRTFAVLRFPQLVKGSVPWFGIEASRSSGDEHEFFGIREYKQGDPIKRIHWLTTARKNRLIVKQFQRQAFFRATIVFSLEKDKNYGEGKETVCEYMVKIAASVSKYLIDRGVSVELLAHIGEMIHLPFNRGSEHLEDLLKFMAVAQAESRISVAEIFQEYVEHIPTDSTLIVIVPDEDWGHLVPLLSLVAKNISLIPLVLVSSSFLSPAGAADAGPARVRVPQALHFHPIFFFRGSSLEESFY